MQLRRHVPLATESAGLGEIGSPDWRTNEVDIRAPWCVFDWGTVVPSWRPIVGEGDLHLLLGRYVQIAVECVMFNIDKRAGRSVEAASKNRDPIPVDSIFAACNVILPRPE